MAMTAARVARLECAAANEITAGACVNVLMPSVFSLIFVGIGALLLRAALSFSAKARASQDWPTAPGEISHSAVLWQTQTSPTQARESTFKADICYRYKVNGKSYSSSKIRVLDLAATRGSADEAVGRYPDNSSVQVYYNPEDPSDAVLEPGSSGGLTVLFAGGGAFVLAGLFFLLMSLTGHVHLGPWHSGSY